MTIYFDNAATSFPKPPSMTEAMCAFQEADGANPGRSGHRMSVAAGRILYDARDRAAELFGVADPLNIAFTLNATMALNIALNGAVNRGNHVITTSMEHNSLARPLRWLETTGVELTVIPADRDGKIKAEDIIAAFRPNTALVAMTHASNVTGTIMPVAEVGHATANRGIKLLVDASQTAGSLPIDVESMDIDLLAFTGHKSMFGPMGTGGLYVSPEIKLPPLMRGGTGSLSEEDIQPDFMPDRLESGTPNTIGAAGLAAGLEYIENTGLDVIAARKKEMTARFLAGLLDIKGVTVYGPERAEERLAVIPLNIAGRECSEVAQELDDRYGILVRAGLHCAPWAHKTIGTYPAGAVRFSFGYFNSDDEIDTAVTALAEIAAR